MQKPRIGLLPFYIELYDLTMPEIRPSIDAFHEQVAQRLEEQDLDIVQTKVCRVACEFEEAVQYFRDQDVDAVVTLHLAYSPSLESSEALKKLDVPILVLDTTPDYVYDQTTDAGALMLNHGIHGVQDMCNLLRRNGKCFRVYAGHMEHSDVMHRIAGAAKAAMMGRALKTAKVGLVGEPFAGMGDFALPFEEMRRDLGVQVVDYNFEEGRKRIDAITETEVQQEFEEDSKQFVIDPDLSRKVYDRSAKVCLAIRKWIEEEKLSALSINYLETEGSNPGLPVMPFVECSKAMGRGIGYAGEGDVLTAALTGALLRGFEDVTFTEMFCPNWQDGSIFLSHMGEFNYKIGDGKPMLEEKPFPFTNSGNPTVAYKSMKPGRALIVNLAPFGNGKYLMSIVPGQILRIEGRNTMEHAVNGWFQPDMPLDRMLERFSEVGASHHSVLVYEEGTQVLEEFADFSGIEKIVFKNEKPNLFTK